MIVFKSAGDCVIELKLLDDSLTNLKRKNVVDRDHAKFRCDKAYVVSITNKITKEKKDKIVSDFTDNFEYMVDSVVTVDDFDDDLEKICTHGIHFYTKYETAFFHNLKYDNYAGEYKEWWENGQLNKSYTVINGLYHGDYKMWDEKGKHVLERHFVNGLECGEIKIWHSNGQLYDHYTRIIVNDESVANGVHRQWSEDGILIQEDNYVNGKLHGLYRTFYNSGNLMEQCTYIDGTIKGKHVMYSDSGEVLGCRFYADEENKSNETN
ncbi:MAG: pentapeptide repeat-containing protein [Dasosvirus sp.]|uniref:Pentapeptide repeat-containing protein n=1 Tax=Dasosvirus sp. TaxID=2487764 RepID=A0A3G4ZVL6_9VIRU|nr:MAG: pentapeptide repeat-containing protein [Dasosvirus sp.]